jgi:DNA invertase Pin-like site-specific DNA recombinase
MGTRAALYVRISQDRQGKRAGVERQEADCRELCERRGWSVVGLYCDNDASAYNGHERPEYARLLGDVAAGNIDAVVAWHTDRLWRDVTEKEGFLVLGRDAGLELVATPSGDYDPSSADDRFTSTIITAVAQKESADKARRIARAELARAQRGDPHGGRRGFGYTTDGRRTVRREADAIRDAARRVLRGESCHSIVVDWQRRGLRTAGDRGWTIGKLADLLQQPRIAGLSEYHGEVVAKGCWPAIIDQATHERLVAIFKARKGRRPERPARVYILSGGLLRCGRCGVALRGMRDHYGRVRYSCPSRSNGGCGRIVIHAQRAEETVRDLLFDHLEGPSFAAALERARAAETDDEAGRAVDALNAQRGRLVELGDMLADGELSRAEYRRLSERVQESIAETEGQFGRLESAPVLSLNGQAAMLRTAWDRMTLEERRTVFRAVAEAFVVDPPPKSTSGFQPERVRPLWRF